MAYLPNSADDRQEMLTALGVANPADLFAEIPAHLQDPKLELPPPLSELELTAEMRRLADANRPLSRWDCFLGGGIYSRFVPAIVRATIGRPEFYTAYTPYQAEASQGYLQTIFEFQSMVAELYDLDVANASMYDGATAAAEGALIAVAHTGRSRILASSALNPETLEVLKTYSSGRGGELDLIPASDGVTDVAAAQRLLANQDVAVVIVGQPNFFGLIEPVAELVELAHGAGALALVVADPLAAVVLEPPGATGTDIAAGEGQQLGIPAQLGGPTVGLLACRQELLRRIPGRLVGMTKDSRGGRAYCLTLQTREQHIRRERATSNICTNHALMALAATAYMAKMGEAGMRRVVEISYRRAHDLARRLAAVPGFGLAHPRGDFLWEFVLECPGDAEVWAARLAERGILAGVPLGRFDHARQNQLLVCATEMSSPAALDHYEQAVREMAPAALGAGAAL
jgi:glycine dehydrogenase subunit 1